MEALIHGITTITLGQIAMMLIGALLMYLGIKKEYEPTLLVPDGLGRHSGQLSRNRRLDPSCWRHQSRGGA